MSSKKTTLEVKYVQKKEKSTMNIGYYIKSTRLLNKLTQKQLAKQTGISQQALSTYENDKKEPTISVCIKLADYYGISIDELIGRY